MACMLAAAPPMPAPQPLVHVVINAAELLLGIPSAEVVTPPPQQRIERRNDYSDITRSASTRVGQLMHPAPQARHRLGRGPPLHVVPVWRPLDAASLAHAAAKELETLLAG